MTSFQQLPTVTQFLHLLTEGEALSERAGLLLRRGGEALMLEKMTDRLTVSSQTRKSLTNLAVQLEICSCLAIAPLSLEEWRVEPDRLETVMQQVRASDSVAFASHVYQLKKSPGTPIYLTDQITVQFAEGVGAELMQAIAAALGLRVVKLVAGVSKTFVFQLTSQAVLNPIKLANQLIQLPEVLLAEPNIIVQAQSFYRPRDTAYSQQWHLHHEGGTHLAQDSHINVEAAWDITRGTRSVVVAIADDGFDLTDPNFQGEGKIVAPVDFKTGGFLPLPEHSQEKHGTACAQLAIAEETGMGVVGVAPGCALMPIGISEFLDDQAIEQICEWVIQQGASVLLCAWGAAAIYFPLSLRQRAAFTRAATQGRAGKGCAIVFAAGNANRPIDGVVHESGWSTDRLQGEIHWLNGFAVHPDLITVSACTSLNQKTPGSNWGTSISVTAPSHVVLPGLFLPEEGYVNPSPSVEHAERLGRPIVGSDRSLVSNPAPTSNPDSIPDSTVAISKPGDGDPILQGTSSAAAIVAGVAALVLSANPHLTAREVKQILQDTADRIVEADPDPQLGLSDGHYNPKGHSPWFGYGKVNAAKAVQAARKHLISLGLPSTWIQQNSAVAIDIPDSDPNGIISPIEIHLDRFGKDSFSQDSLVKDIEISVQVEHEFMGDLEIWLVPPRGEAILLQARTLGRMTLLKTVYTLQTTPLLQTVLYQPAQGTWQLKLVDAAPMHTGRLKNWQLSLGV